MGLRLTRIRTLDEFRRLREPWNDLVAHSDVADVWMTHEWFRCWIHSFGDPANLAILTGWRDGQLVAASPMHIVREKRHGLPFRSLTFISSGVFPRCNFLMEDPCDTVALFDGVLGLDDWDVLETRDLEADKPTTSQWVGYLAAQRRLPYRVTPGRTSPFISTKHGWDAYWTSLSQSFRTHLHRGLRRLEKADSFAVSRIEHFAPFASVFGELVETSAKSWKGSQGTDLKSRSNLQAFLLDFSLAVAEPAPFETWILRINGTVAAFDYYIRSRHTLALMRTDFATDFRYYSPGNSLRCHILADLFARDGVWEYDMGGQARGYKLDWTNQGRPHHTVTAARGFYGKLVLFLKHSTFLRRLLRSPIPETPPDRRHGRLVASSPSSENAVP